MEQKDPEVPKRTSWGSGPHRNKKLDEKKGLVRKTKHKKNPEEQDA